MPVSGVGSKPECVLVLGGSAEGFVLAEKLAEIPGMKTITSFAGRTKKHRKPPGAYRTGGFGGVDGLCRYIKEKQITAIIDATHPFASRIKQNSDIAAGITKVPIIHLLRPPWKPQKGDNWLMVEDMRAAAAAIPHNITKVFLAVGRSELAAFSARDDLEFIARVIDMPKALPAIKNLSFICERGPFSYREDRKLLETCNIKCIVTKNSGGEAAYAKLQAARDLGLPVIMLARPPRPDGKCVNNEQEVLAWLQ
jgi:precorrin-6A/cobalt-precorrin-6A reductase